MEQRLAGKVAIVTGAGQTPGDTIGNGRAIAILFARAGAKVLLVDFRPESAEETGEMIKKEGGEAIVFAADVGKSDDCRRMAAECAMHYGRIDILVNNVGTGGEELGPVRLKEENWDRIYNVNVKSMYLTCKHVIPYMENLIKERESRIPLSGGMGTGWDTAYAALFLASDEAKFITGAMLPVDGGQSGRIG